MADNYYDATGVLVLDKVTPVICALFGNFRLDADFPGSGEAYIGRISDTNDPEWSDVLEGLLELAAGLDLPAPDEDASMETVLEILATHFGATQDAELLNLIEHHDFDDSAELDALLLIASCFNDGHNLTAIRFEGCWHCSKPRLFEFGGHGCFLSREVNVFSDSSQSMQLGSDLRQAILAQDAEAAATHIAAQTRTLLSEISDPQFRLQVRERLVVQLPFDPPEADAA